MYIEFDSELKKIGSQVEKNILKEFAGKFGTQFFHIAIKIEAPLSVGSVLRCLRRFTSWEAVCDVGPNKVLTKVVGTFRRPKKEII